jgi:protocatechuate 3,4-dioxygenase beta subunit
MSQHTSAPEPHDLGLSHDLPRLARRGLLGLGLGLGAAASLAACSDDGTAATPAAGSSGAGSGGGSSASTSSGEIPEETAGPYPGDGSNGPDVLTESGVVRRDLTASFGSATGVAAGVPLTLRLRVRDVAGNDAAPLEGAAIYAWHCDREGRYSMYDDEVADENYLRGVQEADAEGWVEFDTVFPAAYSGRWPHVHVEVYPDLASATTASGRLRTSQLALPEETCREVYATEGYEASVANLDATSLETDLVFSDGWSLQMARLAGSVADGYTATLDVPV